MTISYKNYRKKDENGLPKIQLLVLTVFEFIRRFMLHVLPKGFQRIRYYGVLAARNRKTKLAAAQKALNVHPPCIQLLTWQERLFKLTGQESDVCPFCKTKTLISIGFVPRQPSHGRGPPIPVEIVLFETDSPIVGN